MNVFIKQILLVGSILLLNACIPPPFLPHPGHYQGGYSRGQGYYGGNPGYGQGYNSNHYGEGHGSPHWGGQFSEGHHHGR